MSWRVFTGLGLALIGACLLALSGCAPGSYSISRSGYYGGRGYYSSNTWYDPHYTRRCCHGGSIVWPPYYRTGGHRPAVVRRPKYRYPSAGRPPSIPWKHKRKKNKRPRHE